MCGDARRDALRRHHEQQHAVRTDAELKERHRAMWASGDYPPMVETFLLPLGPRLVEACGIAAGRARARRRRRHRQRVDPGRRERRGRHRERPDARAARGGPPARRGRRASTSSGSRPTPSTCRSTTRSFDVVMSAIGVMFAPHHQAAADELVRVCRPGGTHRAAQLDARGHARRAVPDHEAVRAAASARRAAAAAVGQRGAPARRCSAAASTSHPRARRPRDHRLRATRATTASTSRPTTARRSPPAPTPSATAARRSSTPRSTRSATSGTAARRTAPASRRSTCSRWAHAPRTDQTPLTPAGPRPGRLPLG